MIIADTSGLLALFNATRTLARPMVLADRAPPARG